MTRETKVFNGEPCTTCGEPIRGQGVIAKDCSGPRCRVTGQFHEACA